MLFCYQKIDILRLKGDRQLFILRVLIRQSSIIFKARRKLLAKKLTCLFCSLLKLLDNLLEVFIFLFYFYGTKISFYSRLGDNPLT